MDQKDIEVPRIAFLDIDGTLIDIAQGLREPSEATVQALMNFKQKGNLLVVASSRGVIPECLNIIDFDGFILCDGHYVEYSNEVLINDLFRPKEIDMLQQIMQNAHAAVCYTGHFGDWYAPQQQSLLRDYLNYFDFETSGLDHHNFAWKSEEVKVNSATAIFTSIEALRLAKAELPYTWSIIAYETQPYRMDIYPPGHSKGSACELLFNHLKIERNQTYAFGDGINDVEMLQRVGHGIAMDNASDWVKSHAEVVTDSVLNEGVARAFKKFFE